MCGIAGLCRLDGTPLTLEDSHRVALMTQRLAHRGPDGYGLWTQGPVCLGHRRLSIIDLVGGSQPMHSLDGRYTLVFNGEIYNFAELRADLEAHDCRFRTQSDTEVLLEAYRVWGTAGLDRLEGMFAFALWDDLRHTLFCGRDRFGKKPFFYSVQQGFFAFASELTALETLRDLQFTVDPAAVMRYLAYAYVPGPQTIYAEVQTLPPAHFLRLDSHGLEIRRYWDMPFPDAAEHRSTAALCEELRHLLSRAVRRRMVSDVPLGVFLSGGIDSTIVAGLMARESVAPIKTFSIGFTESAYDESAYAQAAARAFGTEHHVRILSAADCADTLPAIVRDMDVPLADASVAPTWMLSRMTREAVTVALGGDGADELWAGYEHYIGFALAEMYNKLPRLLRCGLLEPLARFLPSSAGYINPRLAVATFLQAARAPAWQRVQCMLTALTPDMQQAVLAPTFRSQVPLLLQPENLFASTRAQYAHWQPENAASPLARAFHVYVRQFLVEDILVKVDRCSMLHGLEVRAPFLDRDVATFAALLPIRYKLHHFRRKWLLKKAFGDLLPPEIRHRNKRGFQIPVAQWLRGRLRPLLEDMCSTTTLRQQGIFEPQALHALMDTHLSGRCDLRHALWTVLVFQLWWHAHRTCRGSVHGDFSLPT